MIIEKEVLGRTFTKEEIMEKALDLIKDNQSFREVSEDATKEDLAYAVAYNDGVIDLANELIKEIEA